MTQQPNKSEIAVLKHLWGSGPQSAREVHDAIAEAMGWSYSTTRTVINRMADKDWIARKDIHGIAVFEAAVSKVAVFGGLLEDLTRRVFDIEGELPVSMFSGSPHLSEDELDELEALVNKQDTTGESV